MSNWVIGLIAMCCMVASIVLGRMGPPAPKHRTCSFCYDAMKVGEFTIGGSDPSCLDFDPGDTGQIRVQNWVSNPTIKCWDEARREHSSDPNWGFSNVAVWPGQTSTAGAPAILWPLSDGMSANSTEREKP